MCFESRYVVGVFLPLIMDEYDQIDKPIMTTVFNPLITRLWRINHVQNLGGCYIDCEKSAT